MDYACGQSPVRARTRRDRPMMAIVVLLPLWLIGVIVPSIGTKENLDAQQFISFAWLPIVATCACRSRFLLGPLLRQNQRLIGLMVACVLTLAASSLLSVDPFLSLGFVATAGLGLVSCAGLWGAIGAAMPVCVSTYAILGSALAGFAYYVDIRVQGRLTLGTAHPNFLGIMAFGLAIAALTVRPRIFAALLVAGNIFIIIETESRSALGAVLLALLAFAFLHAYQVRERKGALVLIGVILCSAIGVALYHDTIESWFSSLFFLNDRYRGLGTGFTGREGAWQEAIGLFMENPIFGVGFRMHEQYMTVTPSAHNGFLSLLAETGIVGSVPLLALTAMLLWHLLREALSGETIAILGFSFVTGYLFISFFERLFLNMGNPTSILVWIFLLAPRLSRNDARSWLGGKRKVPVTQGIGQVRLTA
jgi:O-antigen ligase